MCHPFVELSGLVTEPPMVIDRVLTSLFCTEKTQSSRYAVEGFAGILQRNPDAPQAFASDLENHVQVQLARYFQSATVSVATKEVASDAGAYSVEITGSVEDFDGKKYPVAYVRDSRSSTFTDLITEVNASDPTL